MLPSDAMVLRRLVLLIKEVYWVFTTYKGQTKFVVQIMFTVITICLLNTVMFFCLPVNFYVLWACNKSETELSIWPCDAV